MRDYPEILADVLTIALNDRRTIPNHLHSSIIAQARKDETLQRCYMLGKEPFISALTDFVRLRERRLTDRHSRRGHALRTVKLRKIMRAGRHSHFYA